MNGDHDHPQLLELADSLPHHIVYEDLLSLSEEDLCLHANLPL